MSSTNMQFDPYAAPTARIATVPLKGINYEIPNLGTLVFEQRRWFRTQRISLNGVTVKANWLGKFCFMSRDGREMKLALRDNVKQRVVIADSVKYPVGPAITGNWAWLYGLPVIGMLGSLVGVIWGLHLAKRMRDVHLTPIEGTERSRVHTGLVLFGLVMALRLAVVAVAIAAIRK